MCVAPLNFAVIPNRTCDRPLPSVQGEYATFIALFLVLLVGMLTKEFHVKSPPLWLATLTTAIWISFFSLVTAIYTLSLPAPRYLFWSAVLFQNLTVHLTFAPVSRYKLHRLLLVIHLLFAIPGFTFSAFRVFPSIVHLSLAPVWSVLTLTLSSDIPLWAYVGLFVVFLTSFVLALTQTQPETAYYVGSWLTLGVVLTKA
jgi:flagellar biosynthesis protein FliQ